MLKISQIHQVGIVVRDLDLALRHYWERLGIGPWTIYTYGPPLVQDMTYRGRRQDYRMRLAFCWVGPVMIELIQSLEGPNIYEEFLARGREGLHHLLQYYHTWEEFEQGCAALEAAGYSCIQSGRGYGADGDGGYAYFDTEKDFGTILELAHVPRQRRPPEGTYPASAEGQP